MTILKLTGVAFEIHLTNRGKLEKATEGDGETPKHAAEDPIDPGFMDLFHYTFSYIGMMVGMWLFIIFMMYVVASETMYKLCFSIFKHS